MKGRAKGKAHSHSSINMDDKFREAHIISMLQSTALDDERNISEYNAWLLPLRNVKPRA